MICIFSVSDCLSRDVGVWKKKKKNVGRVQVVEKKEHSRNECNSQRMGFGSFWKINKMTQLIRIETNQEQSFFFFFLTEIFLILEAGNMFFFNRKNSSTV